LKDFKEEFFKYLFLKVFNKTKRKIFHWVLFVVFFLRKKKKKLKKKVKKVKKQKNLTE
jgi:hypothetical protein